MFVNFYKEAERLHEAVKPFRYSVAMIRLNRATEKLVEELRVLVSETLRATEAGKDFLMAIEKNREK